MKTKSKKKNLEEVTWEELIETMKTIAKKPLSNSKATIDKVTNSNKFYIAIVLNDDIKVKELLSDEKFLKEFYKVTWPWVKAKFKNMWFSGFYFVEDTIGTELKEKLGASTISVHPSKFRGVM